MKAKTLMGMIACAGACVSLSAFGNTTNDWFSVGVTGEAIAPVNCSTNGAAVSIANSKIVLDNEYATRLAITPAVGLASTNSTDVAKIDVTALLTPSSTNDLPANIEGAKAGFAVGVNDQNATNFYGFANGVWVKLTGDASNADTQDTTFSIVLDYRVPNVRFYLGDTLLASDSNPSATAFPIAGNTFGGIDAFGSGSITSITGGYEVAVCAVENGTTTKKYGSLADALANGGSSANIVDVNANGTTGVSTAANGLSVAVCKALGISTTEANTPAVAITPVASDTDQNNINFTLAESVNVEPGVAVTFSVKKNGEAVEGSPFASNAIKIPLSGGTGVYTIEPAGVAAK